MRHMKLPRIKIPRISVQQLSIGLMCVYVLLCAVHFFSMRPLWLDENFVLQNLQELQPREIFGPLKYAQGFPRVYLFVVQKIAILFDFHVCALRALPFFFMMCGFFLWQHLYKREEGIGVGYVLFLLSWCGSHFMTYYAVELKQYSGDLCVAAICAIFILNQKKHLKSDAFSLWTLVSYMVLPAMMFVSYTAYFFLIFPLYNLVFTARSNKTHRVYGVMYCVAVACCIVVSYTIDVQYTQSTHSLRSYWNDYFISTKSLYEFFKTFWEGLRSICSRWLSEEKLIRQGIMSVFLPTTFWFIFVDGFTRWKEDQWQVVSVRTMTPFLIGGLCAAGILKVYPFTGARITLFLAPFILYSLVGGIQGLKERFLWLYWVFITVYTGLTVSIMGYLFYYYITINSRV